MKEESFGENVLALIRHKDIMRRQIVEIVPLDENTYRIVEKKGEKLLTAAAQFKLAQSGLIVCENTKKNIDLIAKNWDALCKNKNTLLLLNPLTGINWSITPFIHAKICEGKDMSKSLISLYKTSLL